MCLLCQTILGTGTPATAISKRWNWTLQLNGKTYRSSDSGQSVAKIPTLAEIGNKCHCRDMTELADPARTNSANSYWTSDDSTGYTSGCGWMVVYMNQGSNVHGVNSTIYLSNTYSYQSAGYGHTAFITVLL